MQALHNIACSKTIRCLSTIVLVGAIGCGAAAALGQQTGGPSRSGPGAEVYFVEPKDGATVPAKLKLYFG